MQEIVLGWVDRKVGDRWVILLTEPATTTPKTEFTATVEDYPTLSVGDYVRLTLNEGNIVKIETDKKEKALFFQTDQVHSPAFACICPGNGRHVLLVHG